MKRNLCKLLAAVMAAAMLLTACGAPAETAAPAEPQQPAASGAADAGTGTDADSAAPAEGGYVLADFKSDKPESEWKLAVVPQWGAAPWWVRGNEGTKRFASETGLNAYEASPSESEVAAQIQVVEDLIAQDVWKLSGLPKSQVIGTGTALDSARLKALLGGLVGVDPRSVHAFALGEHGDSQMVPWSRVTVGGKTFAEVLRDNPGRFEGVDLDRLVHDTVQAGWEILKRKGTTYYGIATTAAGIIKCILHDENRIIPVSTLLEGEYGESGVFCGVPAVIGRGGVQEIVRLPLTGAEEEKFHASCEVLRGFVKDL